MKDFFPGFIPALRFFLFLFSFSSCLSPLVFLLSILISEDFPHSSFLYHFIGANNINRQIKN